MIERVHSSEWAEDRAILKGDLLKELSKKKISVQVEKQTRLLQTQSWRKKLKALLCHMSLRQPLQTWGISKQLNFVHCHKCWEEMYSDFLFLHREDNIPRNRYVRKGARINNK